MGFFKRQDQEAPSAPTSGSEQEQAQPGVLDEFRREAGEAHLPEHALGAVNKELERLARTDPSFPEYSIGCNYLEFMLKLPWRKSTVDRLDLERAKDVLDSHHAGLGQVKERVLEHLALAIMRQSRALSVLVVDDEPIALENMAYALGKDGYEVERAANGTEALHKLDEKNFDVVVSDLKMAGVDGMALLETFQEVSPDTEFFVVTGYATVDSAVEAMRKGATNYLAKPLNLEMLRRLIRESAATRRRIGMGRAPVLCFSGPPGVGKTSIGQSIAESLGRKFVRLSMSGMRDEAELKGHRRTYVGAMPGRILNELRRLEVNNPVFMLDEVDKASQGFRGDPVAVLLELLDPEQNHQFLDYYVDVPFDLSGIMFIMTANVVEELPRPLLDRMEVIPFSSYTTAEKLHIASSYLAPRQMENAGLAGQGVEFTGPALTKVIEEYTREPGVRNLERTIGGLCRKLDRLLLQKERTLPLTLEEQDVEELLGPPVFRSQELVESPPPGLVPGLVWTEHGGHVIFVEAVAMEGRGRLLMTGSLGKVLRESAQTALSNIRNMASELGIEPGIFQERDIHVHIPEGAVPKDGPSAGVTIAVALASALTNRPVRTGIAMTGEVTLTGRVMPVSGLREKILAATRAGVQQVIVPEANRCHVQQLDLEITQGVEIHFVGRLEDVLKICL